MGITDKILLSIAKRLYPNVSKIGDLTQSQINKIKEIYEETFDEGAKEGKKGSDDGEDKGGDKTQDLRTTGAAFKDVTGPFVDIVQKSEDLLNAFSPDGILKGVDELINKSQELANNMGLGRARADELRATIANSVPEMIKLGISEDEALSKIAEIPKKLGVNTTLTKETIVEIGAASQFSKVSTGELADKFKSVGMNLADVGDRMAEAANYAKSVGVNVEAVTSKLVSNLKNLNLFNFEGGVKGMAKMVAQSEMLGGTMNEVLQKAENLLNPENAIEFSAALQRLGVQSSALLDPLSAMDMALNDPAALQNEMVKVSQQFTRLKADGSGFEILPGAKLQLREVAEKLGMTADQFAQMSIKSADLEMKMSKIRFPGFAASEEDKQLIANMAQMKDGKAVVTIAKKEGGTEEVNVEDLTAEQLEKLKEEQANQNKTAEEIARDQLTVLKDISAQLSGTEKGIMYGGASLGPVQRITDTANELRRTITTSLTEKITGESFRKTLSGPVNAAEQGLTNALATGDITEIFKSFKEIPGLLVDSTKDVASGGIEALQKMLTGGEFVIKSQYKDITGKPTETNITSGFVEMLQQLKEKVGGKEETPKTSNVNINQTLEIKGASDQVTTKMITTAMDAWWNDKKTNPTEMNKLIEGMDKTTTGSGMSN